MREILQDTGNGLLGEGDRLIKDNGGLFKAKKMPKQNKYHKRNSTFQYKCDCGRSFSQNKHLNYHRKWICGKPSRFKCNECFYGTYKAAELKNHIQRKH